MKKKSYIFDLDGTLIDSVLGISASANYAINEITGKKSAIDFRPFVGPSIRTIFSKVLELNDTSKLDKLEGIFRKHYNNIGWRESKLYEGVYTVLNQLYKNKYDLYILTNKPLIPTNKILEFCNIKFLFKDIMTPDRMNIHVKNKSEMALVLVENNAISGSIHLIGDSIDDQHAAEVIKAKFLVASYGYGGICRNEINQSNFLESFLDINKHTNL